jgi:hypothetical protein
MTVAKGLNRVSSARGPEVLGRPSCVSFSNHKAVRWPPECFGSSRDGPCLNHRYEHRYSGQQFAVEGHIDSCLFITTVFT